MSVIYLREPEDVCPSEFPSEEYDEANAQLIAAAPMMLDALERALSDMDNIDNVCKIAGVHPFSLMRKDLEAAIRAAKGE